MNRIPIKMPAMSTHLRNSLDRSSGLVARVSNKSSMPEIAIFDEIGSMDTSSTPDAVRKFLRDNSGKTVRCQIDSGGGNAFAGLAIFNLLCMHDADVITENLAIAGSAAAIIFEAGTTRRQMANASLYVHRAQCLCFGNVDDYQELMDILNQLDEQIAKSLAARSGMSLSAMMSLMKGPAGRDGTELDAAATLKAKLCDEIVPLSGSGARNSTPISPSNIDERVAESRRAARSAIAARRVRELQHN